MSEVFYFGTGLIVLFAIAFLASWMLTRLYVTTKRVAPPDPGTKVRMKSPHGMHRSHFVEEQPGGWVFSAPLSRDRHVPLRRGEKLLIEAPRESGLMLFQSTVLDRRTDPHMLLTERPKSAKLIDRREARRRTDVDGSVVYVDGGSGVLRDLSEGGARVGVAHPMRPGERIKLEVPWRAEPIYAAVLDVDQGSSCSSLRDIRLCFEEPFKQGSQKAKTAPAV
jgi:hypothetical protein